MNIYIYLLAYVHMSMCIWRTEKGTGSLRDGAIGICKTPSVLCVLFLWQDTMIMIKATCRRKYLIWSLRFQRFGVQDHHCRGMKACRQIGLWSNSWEPHLDSEAHKQRVLAGNSLDLWKPQSLPPSDTPPLIRPHPLALPKQFHQLGCKHSNVRVQEPFSLKPPYLAGYMCSCILTPASMIAHQEPLTTELSLQPFPGLR